MTENPPGSEIPEVEVGKRRGVSVIWLIPIVAVVIGASLAYKSIVDQGPSVRILFESAQGIEPGKTKVKFRDVEIGTVDAVTIQGLDHVVVHCNLVKGVEGHLGPDTQFWVVRPRVGIGGVTGLGTLISGAYIAMLPTGKKGPSKREFAGLENPPLMLEDAPGLHIVLHSDQLGSLAPNTPIYFREIRVGSVASHKLSKDATRIDVDALIDPEYAHLVQEDSRFWDVGGVEVSIGTGGLDVKTGTLRSILGGGVAFESSTGGKPAKSGAEFWLHSSRRDIAETAMRYGGLGVIVETPQLGGLKVGDPVYFRELPVGEVVATDLSKDASRVQVRLNVARRYEHLVRSNSIFWNASGISANLGLTGLHVHAESLESLLAGGVAFATPPEAGEPVADGTVFPLHPKVEDKWLGWSPDPKTVTGHSDSGPSAHEQKHHFLRGLFHHKD